MRRVARPEPLDLHQLGVDRVIAVYLVETSVGPALHDCGPRTCVPALKERLRERGLALTEIKHLLLSHIHLDHAGAAGSLVSEHPGLQVHVSAIGAPHLVDPARLIASATRVYGDELDVLYGQPLPVPARNVRLVADHVAGLECFPAPGHASHHVCYAAEDGTLYAGDAAGVRILPGCHVLPHAPPPDTDVAAWERTFAELARHDPERLALTHFGVVDDPPDHLERALQRLRAWAERARDGLDEDEFVSLAQAELAPEAAGLLEQYDLAAPLPQSFAGLSRYWRKRREGTAT
jgi:glyoxylase-like metal-dependent hydrolase (beta-lactamase superfamily II)